MKETRFARVNQTRLYSALKVWQTEFGKIAPGVKVNYPGGGSGQGRTDFLTGKTDFGASDVQITALNYFDLILFKKAN